MKKLYTLLLLILLSGSLHAEYLAYYPLTSDATDFFRVYDGTNGASSTYGTRHGFSALLPTGLIADSVVLPEALWNKLGTKTKYTFQAYVDFKSDGGNNNQGMFFAGNTNGYPVNNGFNYNSTAGDRIQGWFYTTYYLGSGFTAFKDQWARVNYEYNNGTISIYINGVLIPGWSIAGQTNLFASAMGTQRLSIGRDCFQQASGTFGVRNFVVTDTALGGAEIPPPVGADSSIVSWYNFENSNADWLNTYPLTNVGTGPVYQTDIKYNGSYSYSVQVNNANYSKLSSTLVAELATYSKWNFEGKIYTTAGMGAGNWYSLISNNWTDFSVFLQGTSSDATLKVYLMYNGVETSATISAVSPGWQTVTTEWDGNNVRVFVNGTQRLILASSVNIFATSITPFSINSAIYNPLQTAARVDKIIVSNTLKKGFESLPIDPLGYYPSSVIVALEHEGDGNRGSGKQYEIIPVDLVYNTTTVKYDLSSGDYNQNRNARMVLQTGIDEQINKVEFWIYLPTGTSNDMDIFSVGSRGHMYLQNYLNQFYFLINGTYYDTWTGTITRDAWHRISITLDGVNGYGYVDGVQKWSRVTSLRFTRGYVWTIGNALHSSGARSTTGYIDRFILSTDASTGGNEIIPSEATPVPTLSPTPSLWPAACLAVWEFEGDKVDIKNRYMLLPSLVAYENGGGTGGNFISSPIPPFGTYSYNTFNIGTQKWDYMPTEPQVQLGKVSTGKWTIEGRIFFPTKTAAHHALYWLPRGGSTFGMRFWDSTNAGGTATTMWYNGTAYTVFTGDFTNYGGTIVTNAFNRVTLCYDGSYVKTYTNGLIQHVTAASQPNIFKTPTYNLQWYTTSEFGNDFGAYFLKGLDRLILYDGDTHGAEITDMTPTPIPTLCPGTIQWPANVTHHWSMNEIVNSALPDDVGTAHLITTMAGTFDTVNKPPVQWAKGSTKQWQNGKTLYAPLSVTQDLASYPAFTISWYSRMTPVGTGHINTMFMMWRTGTNSAGFDTPTGASVGPGSTLYARIFGYNINTSYTPIFDTDGDSNKWINWAYVWTGTRLKWYRDNFLIADYAMTSNPFVGSTVPLSIGNDMINGGDRDLTGNMTEFIITNNAVTSFPIAPSSIICGTPTFTITPTDTPTSTPTFTDTVTETITPTVTPTDTQTVTETVTPTITPTVTETVTPTITPTYTVTSTYTVTPTRTVTSTFTVTKTVTPTTTRTRRPTITMTRTPYYHTGPIHPIYPTRTPVRTPTKLPWERTPGSYPYYQHLTPTKTPTFDDHSW